MASSELFALDGKVALVTGASRGLGWAMARALADHGAHVALNGRQTGTLQTRAQELAAVGLSASVAPFDVRDETAARRGVDDVVTERGRLDILLNNAGIIHRGPLDASSTESWRQVLDTNLTACYVLAREAARVMKKPGRIINVGSVLALVGRERVLSYVASKHGLAGLTRGLAAELGPRGITVNAICPGYFRTEINLELQQDEAFDRRVVEGTPLGRWGVPEELGGAAVFLAAESGSFVNGHLLVVDGGLTATI